jgi:membrane carboxypeptidase/penicillin-binding protein
LVELFTLLDGVLSVVILQLLNGFVLITSPGFALQPFVSKDIVNTDGELGLVNVAFWVDELIV